MRFWPRRSRGAPIIARVWRPADPHVRRPQRHPYQPATKPDIDRIPPRGLRVPKKIARGASREWKAQGRAKADKTWQQFLILNEFTTASIEASLKKLLAFSGA